MLLALAVLMELAFVALHITGDLQHHVGEAVALLLAASLFYLVSVWLVLGAKGRSGMAAAVVVGGAADAGRGAMWVIVLAGLVFRVTLFPLPNALSDDLYRYRWEGKLQSQGGNPYLLAPKDAGDLDAVYRKVDGKDFRAVYGPLLELEERAAYEVISRLVADPVRQVFWFKVPAALTELAAAWAVWLLLRARNLPAERLLIFFWCPVEIFVFWGTGHNDALVVLLTALAYALAARGSRSTAYLLLSCAAGAKLWPAALFPAFTEWKPRQVLLAACILAAVITGLAMPFGGPVISNLDFTSGFLGGWRNNDSVFGVVLRLARDPYRAKRIVYALTAAAVLGISLTRWPLERKALWTICSILLFSSNVHPWYLSWLLPLLAVEPAPALLLFVSVVPVFYEAVIGWTELGVWNGVSGLRWWVYGGVALTFLISRKWTRIYANRKSNLTD